MATYNADMRMLPYFLASALLALGCDRGASAPPSPAAADTASAPPRASVAPSASAVASAPASAAASVAAAASASAAAPGAAAAPVVPTAPPLFDDAGALLPQTDGEPSDASPLFQHRLRLLFHAIVHDDPERARTFFFPVEAYEKVKAIAKPGRDWNKRLWKLFVRDVHAYHRELGDDPAEATFVGFDPRTERKKWMKPHTEGNNIGYWRMTRSHLRFRDAAGKERKLEITGLISWRGEWHLVHLHGFK